MPDSSAEQIPHIHIPGVSELGTPGERTNVHHVFIIDGSGSMKPVQRQTITGFNEQVQNIRQLEQQDPNQRNLVTLVIFNGSADVKFFDTESISLQEITDQDYSPMGSTALYSTVGETVTRLRQTLGENAARERVIITIMTDGENTDHHSTWNQNATAELLQQVQKDFNWVVTFIGANIDVATAAKGLNIPVSNSVAYTTSAEGTQRAFDTANMARANYMAASSRLRSNEAMGTVAFYSPDLARGLDLRDESQPEATSVRRRLTQAQIDALSNLMRGTTTQPPAEPVVP